MDIWGLIAVLAWIVLFCMNVAPGCALNMTCRQTTDRTIYTILGKLPSVDCSYSYLNTTYHKIAHNNECVPALVLNNSFDSLVTSKCIGQVFYEATCNEGQYYSANCTVVCNEFHDPKETSDAWPAIVGVVLTTVVVVVLVVVVTVVGKKLKQKYAQMRRSDVEMGQEP